MKKSNKSVKFAPGEKVKLLDDSIAYITEIDINWPRRYYFGGVITGEPITVLTIWKSQHEIYKIPPSLVKEKIK